MGEMNDRELRKRWRSYWEQERRAYDRWAETGYDHRFRPPDTPFPPELRGMTCGAKTRAGTPCKQRGLYDSGRCRLHGGRSTGPRTEEGKRRSAENGRCPKVNHAHLAKPDIENQEQTP